MDRQHGRKSRSSRTPDLILCCHFLCSWRKDKLLKYSTQSLNELKKMRETRASISQASMQNVYKNMKHRLSFVVREQMRHFEHLLNWLYSSFSPIHFRNLGLSNPMKIIKIMAYPESVIFATLCTFCFRFRIWSKCCELITCANTLASSMRLYSLFMKFNATWLYVILHTLQYCRDGTYVRPRTLS